MPATGIARRGKARCCGVDYEDVHGRVVNLHDIQRPRSNELSGDGDEVLQGRRIVSLAGLMSSIKDGMGRRFRPEILACDGRRGRRGRAARGR